MSKFQIKGYDHDGILLNVSGERDEDECQIERITAADSEIDLYDIFPVRTIRSMADKIDADLAKKAKKQNAEECAEQRHANVMASLTATGSPPNRRTT